MTVSWLVVAWVYFALTSSAADAYLGQSLHIGQSLRKAIARTTALMGTGFLYYAGIGLALILLVIPAVYASVAWAVFLPVMAVEGKSGTGALGRSADLTSRARGRVGLLMLFMFIVTIAAHSGVTGFVPGDLRQDVWLGSLLEQIPVLLVAPLGSCLYVLIYFDGRIRDEGWDLEMRARDVPPLSAS
jgi:hypothetical protein